MVASFHLAAAAATALLSLSSPNVKTGTTTEEYGNLLTWLDESFSTSYIHPSIKLAPSTRINGGGGHGAFVTSSLSENDLIFKIPREACITSSDVLQDEDCGKVFKALIDKAGPGGFTVCLAGYLAKEYLCHLESKELDNGVTSPSKFGPYLDTLPWKRGWNGQEHVLYWTNDEIETYLKGSLCWKESNDLRGEVKFARNLLNGLIGPAVLKARDEIEEEKPLIPFLEFTKPPPPKITAPVDGLGRAVRGAFVILLTRAFDDDYDSEIESEDAERLIPLLDMLNHDNEPTITYKTNPDDGSIEVRARRDVEAGEELFNRYREEEEMNMPYHRFFSRFGFVPNIDESPKNLLEDKSSIFFAKKREV